MRDTHLVQNINNEYAIPQNANMMASSDDTAPVLNTNQAPNLYVKQDPPKWLTHPVALDDGNQIKVYDFKEGSHNDELRRTNDTDGGYECDMVENPILKTISTDNLQRKMLKKQQKRVEKFEKAEGERMEEAKRSGSVIEDYSHQANRGMNEPLLAGNRSDSDDPEAQNMNNNLNLAQEERVFL